MTAITNLYSTYSYPVGKSNLPIVVAMHGYGGASFDPAAVLNRMARYNAFVISPGMRGRNGASGSQDSSGREIYDIYDAIEYVKITYPTIINPNNICITGYSGGGGNALAFACKFPDYANVIVSHFGMSDYGYLPCHYDGNVTWMGGTYAEVPNNYRARCAKEAIGNFSGGHLYFFHDTEDATLPVCNSIQAAATMAAAGLTNYSESYTDASDDPRWIHGNPAVGDSGEPCIQSEPIWLQAVVDGMYPAWTIPTSGTLTVIGYIKTKRFTIWLNSGIDAEATVSYDTTTHQYTVTPLTTADVAVTITEGSLTASGTISGVYTFTAA